MSIKVCYLWVLHKRLEPNLCMQISLCSHTVWFRAFVVPCLVQLSRVTRKPVFGVFDQVRLKQVCSAKETSKSLEILIVASLSTKLPTQRTTKVLIDSGDAQADLHLCCSHMATRASARRGTNTPILCHFIMYKNNLSLWQWYKAKSMDHEIYITDPHIFYKVILWVTLIHYPKCNISPSNNLQDMTQNRWTIKYRSMTYIYLVRSIYV